MNIKYIETIRDINGHDFWADIVHEYKNLRAKNISDSTFYTDRGVIYSILETLYSIGAIDTKTLDVLCDYINKWIYNTCCL